MLFYSGYCEVIQAYIELTKHVFRKDRGFFFQSISFGGVIRFRISTPSIARLIFVCFGSMGSDYLKVWCTLYLLSTCRLSLSWMPSRLAANLKTTIVEAARGDCSSNFFSSIDIVGNEGSRKDSLIAAYSSKICSGPRQRAFSEF